jgi:hypothetical protein
MLIISPWAKAGYVAHNTVYEFASVLRTMEETFNIPTLGTRDSTANDTFDSFDFSQKPLPPLILQTHACPLINSSLYVGGTLLNTTSSNSLTFFNAGTSDIDVSSMTVSSGEYTASGCAGVTVQPQKGCTISVNFKPTTLGSATGTITVVDNDPSSPQTVSVSGIGSTVKMSKWRVDFPQQVIGTTAMLSFKLTNTDTKPLTIYSIMSDGYDFTQTNTCPTTLNANRNCTITVAFTPIAAGPRWGQINVTDSDPASPQQIRTVGVGINAGQMPMLMPATEQPSHVDEEDDPDYLEQAGKPPKSN